MQDEKQYKHVFVIIRISQDDILLYWLVSGRSKIKRHSFSKFLLSIVTCQAVDLQTLFPFSQALPYIVYQPQALELCARVSLPYVLV